MNWNMANAAINVSVSENCTWARERCGDRDVQKPLHADQIAVLKLDRRRGVPLAADTLLVVEVVDSSLAYDRDTKGA